nr:hypothetical protein [Bacilli bacterium]
MPFGMVTPLEWVKMWKSECLLPDDAGNPKFDLAAYVTVVVCSHSLQLRFDTIYAFDGRYFVDAEDKLKDFIRQTLAFMRKATLKNIEDAYAILLIQVRPKSAKDGEWNSDPLIPFQNGVLNLDEHVLGPHYRRISCDWGVNAQWHDWAAGTPSLEDAEEAKIEVKKFLTRVVPDTDTLTVLLQYLGHSLARADRSDQHVALLYGFGSNGKSVFLQVLHKLFEGYASSVSLSSLATNRFAASSLVKSAVNIVGDMSAERLTTTDILKAVSGGDNIEIEQKFKARELVSTKVKMWFSVNELPSTADNTHGFYRRMLIFPFMQIISEEERDTSLLQKLTTPAALSYLAYLAISTYWVLAGKAIKPSEEMKQLTATYQGQNDLLSQALADQIFSLGDSDLSIPKWFFQEVLNLYAEQEGRKPISTVKITAKLKDLTKGAVSEKRPGTGSDREHVWCGVGITDTGLALCQTKEIVKENSASKDEIKVVKLNMMEYYKQKKDRPYPYSITAIS